MPAVRKLECLGVMRFLSITILLAISLGVWGEPKYSQFWIKKGYPRELAVVMGETRNAEEVAEKLRASETDEGLFELGRLYFARGLYRQALAFFQRTNFGGDARIYFLGLCHFILGNPDSAKAYFSQVQDERFRPWASAGLGKIDSATPSVVGDYPYLGRFFPQKGGETATKKQSGGYTLQFGAFADSTRAEKLAAKLRDVGLHPYLQKVTIGGRTLYRVRAEHFATKSEAEQAGAALGDEFIYMVVPEE